MTFLIFGPNLVIIKHIFGDALTMYLVIFVLHSVISRPYLVIFFPYFVMLGQKLTIFGQYLGHTFWRYLDHNL